MRRLLQILPFFLLLLSVRLYSQTGKAEYTATSVLSSGKWYKMAIARDGVYRINYSTIVQLGLENPSNPEIFGNNQGQLSYYCSDTAPDDLKQLAVYLNTGNDGIFNEGDYLLFYARGPNRWIYNKDSKRYDFLHHNYSDSSFYFLTSGTTTGKRVGIEKEPAMEADYTSHESDVLFWHEKDNENLIKSGRDWFQQVPYDRGIDLNPGFTDLNTSEKVICDIRVAARSSVPTQFRLYEGETLKKSIQVQAVNLFDYTGTQAQITDSLGLFQAGSSSPVFSIYFYNNGETGGKGWLDYVRLQGRRSNIYHGKIMQFSDSRSVSQGRITSFSVSGSTSDMMIWDVSDNYNVRQIQYARNGDELTFKTPTDTLKTFVAFAPGDVLIPAIRTESLPNQDLHSSPPADMIIITHPVFRSYADRLAEIHYNTNGLTSLVVPIYQIYNEFSGGTPDIAAIRNFVRMKYTKQAGSDHPLKYLLLFGDGSYENKTLPPNNPNFIPTYQSKNSNVVVSSFTSDDFYGLLDDGEGESEGIEDIGIGRLPVSDTAQAGILLSKIKRYINPSNTGEWKNVICLVADDEDGNTHLIDSEDLTSGLNDSVPVYNLDKIYLDAFKQTTSVSGDTYPEVNKAINDRINAGCLIFNYVGHGNETGLASERVVRIEDINSWNNGSKLPLFVTATCEFSRFDEIELNVATREMTGKTSAGEMVLLNKDGGAIALMSTTRLVYSAPNHVLNSNIFNWAFTKDSTGDTRCLGDIIRLAKNTSGNGSNKRNFTLLGDPAIKLAYPWHGKVITDSINGIPVTGNPDTLKALSFISISGHIEDTKGQLRNNFEGTVTPLIFDKETKVQTLANDGGQVMDFLMRNNIIFSGKTRVEEGRFRFTFIVPRDINYSIGNGKISYYASGQKEDMNGYYNGIKVGGFASEIPVDTIGPDIMLYMNDTLFRNGGMTDQNPALLAIIDDPGGINASGSGIGHDITAYLDDDPSNAFVLNSYFVNDFDNYMKGRIIYFFSELSEGDHKLTMKAWDNFNNSSQETIQFHVETGDKFILKNLMNYPNPFFDNTNITAEHNKPGSEFEVIINIYNMNGKIIKIIRTKIPSYGYELPPVPWDGNDDGGKRVGRGVYPYTVTVTTSGGETARVSGRMIIL